MELINRDLYRVLKELGASDEMASAAAASSEGNDFSALKEEFNALKIEMVRLEGKVNQVQWMLGSNLALTLVILGKLFFA
jgi:hypothetical protein